ncbi:MAG: peptidoglycan DD-metalloendopeptidase family protein [Aromatoleum sp.]|nr:peptidoglycan DD-metalloendopeptidase family protein [Aromatoleum sp.]
MPLPYDDMSPARHTEIKASVDASIEALRKAGTLPATVRKDATTPVKFGWPLQYVPGHPETEPRTVYNYLDHNPAFPGQLQDYACGTRSYDTPAGYNHQGTDITPFPFGWRKMDNDELIVVAAAPGIILGRADGAFDRSCQLNSGYWNAIYIQHADGSVAWYGHLKKNSLTRHPIGAAVQAGEYLGVMGSSGSSTGPHLHFELYDAGGNLVDPFAGACNVGTVSRWTAQRPYDEPAINLLTTSSAAIEFNVCPQDETPHLSSHFRPGDPAFLTAYLRDQAAGATVLLEVFRPDGSRFTSATSPPQSAFSAASFWELNFVIPAAGPAGTWRFSTTFSGQSKTLDFDVDTTPQPPLVDVIEYYAPSLNHFFITAFPEEAAALDAGKPVAGWQRTGLGFPAFGAKGTGLATVCRFFGTPGLGVNSHFYTAFDSECAIVKQNPGWTYEGNSFYIAQPVGAVQCPHATRPVFRLYNNGHAGSPNHRYTTSWPVVDEMQFADWVLEGAVMCAPQ